ncbi:MAG: hypothetical protein U0529_20020 [Thermoanaerobaculia bacterium]
MPDLSKLLSDVDFRVTGSRVKVSFPNKRTHQVRVTEEDEAWQLRGVVLSVDAVSAHTDDEDSKRLDLALRAWRRNETARLCGFRLDANGALVGEATVPKIGLTPEELRERVRALARACDLLEAHLTGEDVE